MINSTNVGLFIEDDKKKNETKETKQEMPVSSKPTEAQHAEGGDFLLMLLLLVYGGFFVFMLSLNINTTNEIVEESNDRLRSSKKRK